MYHNPIKQNLSFYAIIEVTTFISESYTLENAAGQLNHTEIKMFSSECSNRRHVFFGVYPIRGLFIFLQQCRRWNKHLLVTYIPVVDQIFPSLESNKI